MQRHLLSAAFRSIIIWAYSSCRRHLVMPGWPCFPSRTIHMPLAVLAIDNGGASLWSASLPQRRPCSAGRCSLPSATEITCQSNAAQPRTEVVVAPSRPPCCRKSANGCDQPRRTGCPARSVLLPSRPPTQNLRPARRLPSPCRRAVGPIVHACRQCHSHARQAAHVPGSRSSSQCPAACCWDGQ